MTTLKFLERETASLAFTGRPGQHGERRKRIGELLLQRGDVGGDVLFVAPHSLRRLCPTRAQVRASLRKFAKSRDNCVSGR